jgi:hypothetical protein
MGGYTIGSRFGVALAVIPGTHVAVLSKSPTPAFHGRFSGWELRDTLLILMPGPGALYVFLYRVPIQAETVSKQVLATGTGGIWIDGCRVSGIDPANAKRIGRDYTTEATYFGDKVGQKTHAVVGGNLSGRWPSNLLLVHASGCRRLGTKRVRAISGGGGLNKDGAASGAIYGNYRKLDLPPNVGKGDADGLETVEAWECSSSCPVKAIDSDTGGASRFFPQFKDLPECLDWITKLLGSK